MEFMRSQSYLIKIQTSDNSILSVWNSLVDMLMQGETGYADEWHPFLEGTSLTLYTTIITSHGKNAIGIEIYRSSERVQHQLFLVKEDLSVAAWAIFQLSWWGRRQKNRSIRSFLQSMEQVVAWEELPPKEKPAEEPENSSPRDSSLKRHMDLTCSHALPKCAVEALTNRLLRIKE